MTADNDGACVPATDKSTDIDGTCVQATDNDGRQTMLFLEYHAMFRMDEGLWDLGGKAPEAESFLFHFFSEPRAEIKRFDRF